MHYYTVQIDHPNGEFTRCQVAADNITDAQRLAYDIANELGRPYDLTMPSKPLAPVWEPLRHQFGASAAEQIAARQAAADREERLRQTGEDAVDDWTEFRARHADNPLAAVALDIHQPVVEWDRVVCQECREADLDDTVGVEWPCGTYAAMKAAADG